MRDFQEVVNQEIQECREKIIEKTKLLHLTERFPDLNYHTDRWGKKYLVSKIAANEVNQVQTNAMCGCCPDASISAKRFIEIDGFRIYALPLDFIIGHYDYDGSGVKRISISDDTSIAEYEQFPDTIKQQIEEYLKNNPFEPYEDDEEE